MAPDKVIGGMSWVLSGQSACLVLAEFRVLPLPPLFPNAAQEPLEGGAGFRRVLDEPPS